MLKTENISYTYPDGTVGIENVSIDLPREHIVGILGKSGSGKTTTLRCLCRFVKPQKGKITLDGQNIFEMDEIEYRKKLGIIFQQLNLFPHLTVLENIMLAPMYVLKQEENEVREESMQMLTQMGVEDLAKKYPAEISGGQAQRVAITRGLMLKPDYLLLDEPTSALDVQTSYEFGQWLVDLKSDTTFVIVTHDTVFVERVASTGVLLEEGKVVKEGAIKEIIGDISVPDESENGN